MAKVGRNEPCPCGSGLKAKRCCSAEEGARAITPRATLARLQREVADALSGVGEARFRRLFDEMIYLPELDVSLHCRLPGVLTPEIERAMVACRDHDDDGFDEALNAAAAILDSAERRLELAEAVLELRDRGLLDARLAAVAIFDLNGTSSAFLISSLAQAIAVRSGSEATPAGLVLAG